VSSEGGLWFNALAVSCSFRFIGLIRVERSFANRH
jgi:hypothetical protein